MSTTDPYVAPSVDADPVEDEWERELARGRWATIVWATTCAGLGSAVVGVLLTLAAGSPAPACLGLAGAMPLGVLALALGALRPHSVASVLGGLAGGGVAALPVLGVGLAGMLFSRGRQLRQDGVTLLAPVGGGDGWAPKRAPVDAPAPRAGLAAAWRENGRTEHASVAAFARLSLELVALGAPARLLADAAADAADEIRHTEACFGLAAALDGRTLSPGPLPAATTAGALEGTRRQRLVELAVSSLVDGALNEGASARTLARLARRVEDPEIRELVRWIAADEGRHAAHGWDVVEWCLREGGEPVRAALREAMSHVPTEIRSPHPADAVAGRWEAWGIVGHALEQAAYDEAVTHLRARVSALVGEDAAAA